MGEIISFVQILNEVLQNGFKNKINYMFMYVATLFIIDLKIKILIRTYKKMTNFQNPSPFTILCL